MRQKLREFWGGKRDSMIWWMTRVEHCNFSVTGGNLLTLKRGEGGKVVELTVLWLCFFLAIWLAERQWPLLWQTILSVYLVGYYSNYSNRVLSVGIWRMKKITKNLPLEKASWTASGPICGLYKKEIESNQGRLYANWAWFDGNWAWLDWNWARLDWNWARLDWNWARLDSNWARLHLNWAKLHLYLAWLDGRKAQFDFSKVQFHSTKAQLDSNSTKFE